MTVTDMRNIARQAHASLRLLSNIPQNLRDTVPQCANLIALSWPQKFLERNTFLLRAVVEDEKFDQESLND